jgi:hypothetical protein
MFRVEMLSNSAQRDFYHFIQRFLGDCDSFYVYEMRYILFFWLHAYTKIKTIFVHKLVRLFLKSTTSISILYTRKNNFYTFQYLLLLIPMKLNTNCI